MMAAILWSCADGSGVPSAPAKPVVEKTVAVVLPMEGGLDLHWRRCLDLYAANTQRAYKGQDTIVRLNFEFYDESTRDLQKLAAELGRRDDVYAVIGGLYSSNAAVLTSGLARVGKTLFTLATSEELVRAYASTGCLWAMTETDITQCEVLLAKAVNYGAGSVALVAMDDDLYGKSFTDWFGFQARELGIENRGVFTYGPGTVAEATASGVESGAEYVICVPSEIDHIGLMLDAYNEAAGRSPRMPRLLFSDTAYGKDVLTLYGEKAEGIEGVTFGADPESGFDVSYEIFFGEAPTTGEAQLYDAAMLAGYAAWYQVIHPTASLQQALREIVTGTDINMGSWTGEDMSLVVDALKRGDRPAVHGASGSLKFDSRIFTNVLATTYYNYRIYDGRYIILDYNSSDGGNRTDATLAGWNWKAEQMQEFEDEGAVVYPPHASNWALLVAASTSWTNYRHQADVLAIYRQLRSSGYPDERIILIAEDDIAGHPSNPENGVIRVTPGGENVYSGARIDYRLSELSPSDLAAILAGEKSPRLPQVVEATECDNVFIFWSGHGVPGALCWGDEERGLSGEELRAMLAGMQKRKVLMMTEACYSGGVAEKCAGLPGVLLITAAGPDETSKADIFNGEMRVWMSNRFTSTFLRQIEENPCVSLRELYYRLFINTVGSHVMVYNAHNFGNLYSSDMGEFINFR